MKRWAPPSFWATAPRPRPARSWRSSKTASACRSSKPASAVRSSSTRRHSTASPAARSATAGWSRARQARALASRTRRRSCMACFSIPRPRTQAEIKAVEDLANTMVLQNSAVETHLMGPDEAIAKGALALFVEKYGEEVRVVSMGRSEASDKADHAYSIELCGGTHVRRTGDIGLLKIVGESAVASGVRRIEALTGEGARSYLATQDQRVREAAELLKVGPDEMIERLAAILDE